MNKIANVRSVAAPTVEELVARTRELKPLLSKTGRSANPTGGWSKRSIEAVTQSRPVQGVHAEALRRLGDEYPRHARREFGGRRGRRRHCLGR